MADDNESPKPQPAPAAPPETPDFTGTAHFESQKLEQLTLRGTPPPKPERPIVEKTDGE